MILQITQITFWQSWLSYLLYSKKENVTLFGQCSKNNLANVLKIVTYLFLYFLSKTCHFWASKLASTFIPTWISIFAKLINHWRRFLPHQNLRWFRWEAWDTQLLGCWGPTRCRTRGSWWCWRRWRPRGSRTGCRGPVKRRQLYSCSVLVVVIDKHGLVKAARKWKKRGRKRG